MPVEAGYIGIGKLDNVNFRCSSFAVAPLQEALFYDHTVGLRDTNFSTGSSKGEGDAINVQKYIMRPGVKIVQGSYSLPCDNTTPFHALEYARNGQDFDIEFQYNCDSDSKKFLGCRTSTWNFNVTVGDVANISHEVMGVGIEDGTAENVGYTDETELATWRCYNVTCSAIPEVIQALSVSVNNNLIPIYTSGSLWPVLRNGMQEVRGSITYWGGNSSAGIDLTTDAIINIEYTPDDSSNFSGSGSLQLNVVLQPEAATGQPTAPIVTIPFIGRDRALGNE